MLTGLQTIGIIFAVFASYFTFLSFKRKEFSIREVIAWEAIWIAFVYVTIFPERFSVFSAKYGATRPMDLFVVIGFVVTLSIGFYTYTSVDRLRKTVEKMVREDAIRDIKKGK